LAMLEPPRASSLLANARPWLLLKSYCSACCGCSQPALVRVKLILAPEG
jgi:hypothetical protein